MTTTECSLCSTAFGEIAVGLVEYAQPYPLGRPFDSVPRCRDRAGCRSRVEREGLTWPLADGTRPTTTPEPAPAAVEPRPVDVSPASPAEDPYDGELDVLDPSRSW